MELTLLGVALGYAVPIAALALIAVTRLTGAKVAWVLAALPVFYVGHYLGLQALQGWPTDRSLPPRFEVLAEDVIQPDPVSGADGAVYLWVRAPGQQRPRAYRLPYSKALHREADQAGRRRAAGAPQAGVRVQHEAGPAGSAGGREPPVRIRDRMQPRPPPKASLQSEAIK